MLLGSDGTIKTWKKQGSRHKEDCLRPTVQHGGF